MHESTGTPRSYCCRCSARAVVCVLVISTAMFVIWVVLPVVGYNVEIGTKDAECSRQPYKGSLCKAVLDNITLCLYNNHTGNNISAANANHQYFIELQVARALQSTARNDAECYQAMKPYFCSYYFGLCSANNQCQNASYSCGGNASADNNYTDYRNCSRFFYFDRESYLCRPTCQINVGLGSSVNYYVCADMLGYIVAFVASCFNRKMMYRFPSVLVLYWLAAAAIYDIINLFTCCTSEDYFQNQNHPSYSCLLQGVSFNYMEYLIVTLVLSHTLILFWNVWCPLQAKSALKSRRRHRLHAAVLVFALVLPCILCVGVILGHLLDAAYYAVSVPFNAICGILTTAIGVIVWKLLCLNRQDFCGSAELKLATVLAYLILLFVLNIAKLQLGLNSTNDNVYDYFLCEASGRNTCSLQVDAYIVSKHVFAALFCLAPFFTLVYIVPSREVKTLCRGWWLKLKNVTTENLAGGLSANSSAM